MSSAVSGRVGILECDVYGTSPYGVAQTMNVGKDIDKLTEKLIIEVGRATPSGSGPGVAVIDLSFISGDNFAITNRFVALSERIRSTDAQLRRFVTTLPKTRRYASFALRLGRAASVISAYSDKLGAASFHRIYTESTSRFCLRGEPLDKKDCSALLRNDANKSYNTFLKRRERMKKLVLIACCLIICTMMVPTDANAVNTVIIENKTSASPPLVPCTVGVYITNDIPITGMVLPFETRMISGDGYYDSLTQTQASMWNWGTTSRLRNSPLGVADVSGDDLCAAANTTRSVHNTPAVSNDCSGPTSNSYAGASVRAAQPHRMVFFWLLSRREILPLDN